MVEEVFKKNNIKLTKQRKEVYELLKEPQTVKDIINKNLWKIESIADNVLVEEGFDYTASAKINNEYFPSRSYDGEVYPADYYDALIINLGSGSGDNWWCVAYPPLCFVGEGMGNNIQYKSKLVEMISNFFGG